MEKLYLNDFTEDSFDIFPDKESAIGSSIHDAFLVLRGLYQEDGKDFAKDMIELGKLAKDISKAASDIVKAAKGDFVVEFIRKK